MTRTPLPRLLVLLALALWAPRPVPAQTTTPSPFPRAGTGSPFTDILPANDPIAAMAFLQDPELQSVLKAHEPERYEQVLARAAELKDMNDILFKPGDAVTLRLALLSRPDCAFCQRSTTMWAWIDKYYPTLYEQRRKDLHDVYWDWEQLADAPKAWLGAHGESETGWKDLSLAERRAKLWGWAAEEGSAILALKPKTSAEADAMQNRVYAVYQVLGSAAAVPLMDRLNQVRAGLSGLDRAKAMIGDSKDPAVRQAYEDALKAADPAERLAALSRMYDGLGKRDESVMAQAPPRPGQAFTPQTRQMVAGLLSSGLMNLTAGTWAGQELSDFYASHPMKVAVGEPAFAALAWYHDDVLSFNEKHIERYVRSQGRTLDDLAKDPSLLAPLLREIVPVFVHEATHQRQDAFAKAQGIPFYNGEAAEKEAMMTEALFVLQKSQLDPSYAKFLAEGQERSTYIKETLVLSRRLQKDRADWFGETVMATHYPEYLSIAGQVWCNILWHNRIAPPIEAELQRRAALPEDQRKALEGAGDFKPSASMQDFVNGLPSVGTPRLRDMLARQKQALEKAPDAYAAYVKRLKDVTALTDRRLDELERPAPKRDAVPSPYGDRR